MKSRRKGFAFVVLALAMLATPLLRVLPAHADAPVIEEAQKLYDAAKFTEAVNRLHDALSKGEVSGSDVVNARALMGRALVKAGNRLEAKQAFKTVLRTDPAFRLDAVMVPPDEIDVFNLALKEINAEQIEAGQRVPASLSFFFGVGSGNNKDFAKLPHAGGGKDKFDSQTEFGGSVRFPLRPRLSLDLELARFRATNADTGQFGTQFKYEATAIPMVVNLYWAAMPGAKHRVNLFGGVGPMLASRPAIKFTTPGTGYFVADEKVGFIAQAGIEGEWLFNPKLSLSGRVLGRSAKATGLYKDSEITLYADNVPLKNREVDFSGFGAFVALRAYIGY